jgi:hypothetical protein
MQFSDLSNFPKIFQTHKKFLIMGMKAVRVKVTEKHGHPLGYVSPNLGKLNLTYTLL